MKLVCLMGSPRANGNSAAITKKFCEVAKQESKCEIKYYELNRLNYRGCQACMVCKTTKDKCVMRDDLAEVLDAVKAADIVSKSRKINFFEIFVY